MSCIIKLVHYKKAGRNIMDNTLTFFSEYQTQIELAFMNIIHNNLVFEGLCYVPEITSLSDFELFLYVNDVKIPCNIYRAKVKDEVKNGKVCKKAIGFSGTIPDYKLHSKMTITFHLRHQKHEPDKILLTTGTFFPVTQSIKNAYAYRNGYIFTLKENVIYAAKSGIIEHAKKELLFLKELALLKTKYHKKAIAARCFYHIANLFKKKEMWLISDRINMADDNGEALFKYLNEKKTPENIYFIIRKDSADYDRIRKTGKVLVYNSIKHKLFHLLADATVSSAFDRYVKTPYNSMYFQDILSLQKHILLQHGVAQNNYTAWMNKFNGNFSMIVTSSVPEYNSFLHADYYYDESVIKLTGMPRYDRLFDDKKKIITIMPTWRSGLTDKTKLAQYKIDGKHRYKKEDFTDSKYYHFYNSLLNNELLLKKAEEYGYSLQFMPHPNIIPYIDWFTKSKNVQFCSQETSYRNIFAESALIVTDYSSVAFDFAYLRKPVLYCQFDRGEFHFSKGYFNYERDGFGEVTYNLNDIIGCIIDYMEHDCVLKKEYRDRIEHFFAFHDKNNCKRVYEAIKTL